MDFQICDYPDNPQILLMNDSRGKQWNITMENDEYFNWTNGLKIDEAKYDNAEDGSKTPRKRKLRDTDDSLKIKNACYSQIKDSGQGKEHKDSSPQIGSSRMPQWQVDDINDLNADIEGSLNGLGADHSNNSFNMSEAILSLSGMTVFKQEAPSPTNNDQLGQFRQNPSTPTTQVPATQSNTISESHSNAMLNTTLHQLLSQSGYNNTIDGNMLNSPNALSQDGYGVTSSNNSFTEDCRFQYVLAAATSIATKLNEDTLTYLNQGQSYEIKLKKLGDLSTYRGKLLKSVIRICFHERRLQYMEKEQMNSWQQSRPGDRILEIDVPLSYGLYDVIQPQGALNTVQFSWDPTKEVGAYIKVNCISTEFTPKKHGGEKGVPFRIQVETYQAGDGYESPKRLHAAACQIKVFKLKGADRKHKQDREKILKRPINEQEKYQPSYECTVLNDIPNEAVVSTSPISSPFPSDSGAQNNFQGQSADDKNNLVSHSPASTSGSNERSDDTTNGLAPEHITVSSNLQQTAAWLTANRFEKYMSTFSSFSGADMLRMTRDDLIQICGHADGIRLFNALHSKSIFPMLTIFVRTESSAVFSAVYLNVLHITEVINKLAALANINPEQVKDIYLEGPQSIHIQMTNDVLKQIKDQTMFQLTILPENGKHIILLKNLSN